MIKNNLVTQVILTGGVGSRLWPLSRKTEPKQYLKLFEGTSLFEMTIERNKSIVDTVLVVGNMDNHHLSIEIMINFELNYSFIYESIPRNTAAAIAFAAFDSNPCDILIITPSNHVIVGELQYELANPWSGIFS